MSWGRRAGPAVEVRKSKKEINMHDAALITWGVATGDAGPATFAGAALRLSSSGGVDERRRREICSSPPKSLTFCAEESRTFQGPHLPDETLSKPKCQQGLSM